MGKKKKKPVPVENKTKEGSSIIINPNRIKVRDMRGILLSGCGYHKDKKKAQDKYICRQSKGQTVKKPE